MLSKSLGLSLVMWTLVACGGRDPSDDGDAGTSTSGSGGGSGSGGDAGSSGTGGSSGSGGDAGGGPTTGGAGGLSSTGGSGGLAGKGTVDAGGGRDVGAGGSAGRAGSSGTGGSSGAGGSVPPPPEDAGPPGTQPSCSSLVSALGTQGWVAFDSDHDNFNRNLYMMHADRSALTQLTTGVNNDREPFFSADGKQLSYTSNVNGQSQIFLMDVATRNSIKLTNRSEGADESSLSRDGQWVAFHSGASVYIIKVDGTEEKLVATGLAPGTNAYHWPVFSADGTEIVFDRYNEIEAVRLDGTGFRYIVSNTTTQIKSPAVSSGGTDIAYQGGCYNETGTLSVWTTSFTTTTQVCMGRRVTPLDARHDAKNPAWVGNGVIAYERADKVSNLATIAIISRAADSTPCILTPSADDSRNPTWYAP